MLFAIWELLSSDEIFAVVLTVIAIIVITAAAYEKRFPLSWVPTKSEVWTLLMIFGFLFAFACFVFYPVHYVPQNELKQVEGKFHSAEKVRSGKSRYFTIFTEEHDKDGFRPLSPSVAERRVENIVKGDPVTLFLGDNQVYELRSADKIIFGYQESVDQERKTKFYAKCVGAIAIYLLVGGFLELIVRVLLRKWLLKSESV